MRSVHSPLRQAAGMAYNPQWEQQWLPLWPMASDDFRDGVYKMARGEALGKRYVQANPEALSNLLVVDIDHPDAALRALSTQGNHPMPNAIVENRFNGHAHALWWLLEPITRTEYAKRAPLAYAAAVIEGLRRGVGGDAGYSGFLTKNPVHDHWETMWLNEELRSLRQLEDELRDNMPPKRWRRSRAPVGLGRNCTIFEQARGFGYRDLRNYFGDSAGLSTSIHEHVHALNAEFTEPLPHSEANGIAASIHRWITTKSRMWQDGPATYEATFSLIQSHRGRRIRPGRQILDRTAIEEI
jgi:hypothetical protein